MKIKSQKSEKLEGKQLEVLFRAYFNNKMTSLLMMVEQPELARRILSSEKQKNFLHDMEHHFLCTSKPKYRHAFKWLQCFFTRYPDITCSHIYKAIKMVKLVYEAFGFELPPRLEERRLDAEGFGKPYDKRNAINTSFACPNEKEDRKCLEMTDFVITRKTKEEKLKKLAEDLTWRFSDLAEQKNLQVDLLMARADLLKFIKDGNHETGLRILILEVAGVFHAFCIKEKLSIPDLWVIQDALKLLLTWSQIENQPAKNESSGILDEKATEFFIAWFRNKMTIVLMRLESEMPISESSRQKILFFLDEMEHHFRYVSLEGDPFNSLKDFFTRYPEVSQEERLKTLKLCQMIYEAYGLKFPNGILKRLQMKWMGK